MLDRLGNWFRRVTDSLSDGYREAKKIGSNFWEWLCDAPVIVKAASRITVGLLGCLYLVGYLPNPKAVVRGTGVFLQLVGFVLAAYGLERTLEEFGQTPSTSRIWSWVKGFRRIFNTPPRWEDRGDVRATIDFSDEASAEVERGIHPPQTTPERIRRLEQKLQDVKDALNALRGDVFEKLGQLEDKIDEEVEAVEQEVQAVREKVKEANVGEGALWIEWGAVFSFVYGVPLASFPSSFLPAYRVLIIPVVAGMLLGSLHWYAD